MNRSGASRLVYAVMERTCDDGCSGVVALYDDAELAGHHVNNAAHQHLWLEAMEIAGIPSDLPACTCECFTRRRLAKLP